MKSASMTKNPFDTGAFRHSYHTDRALGCFCSPEGTQFYLWTPTAESVVLRLWKVGEGDCPLGQYEMMIGPKGIWRWESPEMLHGVYYDYLVTVQGVIRQTADPYARAAGRNGARSMAVDLTRTNPEAGNWTQPLPCPRRTSSGSSM